MEIKPVDFGVGRRSGPRPQKKAQSPKRSLGHGAYPHVFKDRLFYRRNGHRSGMHPQGRGGGGKKKGGKSHWWRLPGAYGG